MHLTALLPVTRAHLAVLPGIAHNDSAAFHCPYAQISKFAGTLRYTHTYKLNRTCGLLVSVFHIKIPA